MELAWCAYVDQETYQMLFEKYSGLKEEIYKNTVREEDAYVIAYTKILTEIPGFHKDLEQYEIYNGNKSREQFEEIVLKRYQRWNPKGEIFECAFLQNILENMLLYLQVEEEEIPDFYRRLKDGDPFGASYLKGSVRKGNPHFKIKTGNAGLGKGDRDGICNRRIYAV